MFFQLLHDFDKVLSGLLVIGQHAVAVYHAGPGRDRIGNRRLPAGGFKFRPRAVQHLVRAVIEVDIPHAGIFAPRGGEHVFRHIVLPVAHERFALCHEGIVDGHVARIQRLHAGAFLVVPRHLAGGDGHNVPGRGQGSAQRVVVSGHAQCQRTARGKPAGADVSVAVQGDQLQVAGVGHVVADGDAVLRAEGIDGEPDVAACSIAQLPQHGGVALVRADDHAAAEEEQNGPLGRLALRPDEQARKAVDHPLFVVGLAVGGHEKAPAPIGLFDGLQQLLHRQSEGLLHAGEPIDAAQQ